MQKLKDNTKEYHSRIESLPYFKTLADHQLPLECYVNQLRALSILHGVLERELAVSSDEKISSVWSDELRKFPLLEKDLLFFKPRMILNTHASIGIAQSMAEKIRIRSVENPFTLLGYLYVFEGSTLGNLMHQPDISASFYLPELNGCFYYSSYQGQVHPHWRKFSEKMNLVLADPLSHEPIIEAAHEAFVGLESLYTALASLDKKEKSFHITRINPEAGNHPIPENENEIQASLKASDRGWSEFPYFEKRYGERGKRFSDSDACWLAAIAVLDQEPLQIQIDWICRVLATRGMPSITLEKTLEYLSEELTRTIPGNSNIYLKLKASADILKKRRSGWVNEKEFNSLGADFEKLAGLKKDYPYKNTGKLIASAVIDEKNGLEGAIDVLKKWLTDKERFSEEWIFAVNETIKKANSVING
jgi:heme oxygenase